MKKRFSIILYLLLCSVTLFAEKTTNEDFWVRLDYMIRGTVPFKYEKESAEIELTKWDSKVWVSIQGNYTIADSLELDKAMKNFGEMLPQLGINWAGKSDPSLVVVFSGLPEIYSIQKYNLFKYSVPRNRILLNHRFKIKNTSDGILIVNDTISGNNRLNTIWSSFGKILVEYNGYGYNSGTESVLGGKIRKLTDFDRFFFSTIYADSFTDQYLQFIKGRYNLTDQFRYLTDYNTRYSIIYSIYLIIAFLLTYFSYKILWQNWQEKKNRSKFARFQISGLLFFAPQIFASVILLIPDVLKLQHFPSKVPFILIVGSILFVIFTLLYFIFALVIYLIEEVLLRNFKEYKQKQLTRVFSVIFLTSLFVYFYVSIDRPQFLLSMNIFMVFLSFLLIIVIRFLYFHDQHQKEIIRKHQALRIEKLEELQTKFQLEAIQARTNPHFLYNSLNTIASLASQDPKKTEEFAINLSRFLRFRLNENAAIEVSVQQEIENIRLYLEIETERFFDRLEYSIHVEKNAETLKIPSDILLNLTENAIKHGIAKLPEKGMLKIEIKTNGSQLKMSVSDTGPDFPEAPIYGTGLKSILEKLDIIYPNEYEFTIFNQPDKRIEITLKNVHP